MQRGSYFGRVIGRGRDVALLSPPRLLFRPAVLPNESAEVLRAVTTAPAVESPASAPPAFRAQARPLPAIDPGTAGPPRPEHALSTRSPVPEAAPRKGPPDPAPRPSRRQATAPVEPSEMEARAPHLPPDVGARPTVIARPAAVKPFESIQSVKAVPAIPTPPAIVEGPPKPKSVDVSKSPGSAVVPARGPIERPDLRPGPTAAPKVESATTEAAPGPVSPALRLNVSRKRSVEKTSTDDETGPPGRHPVAGADEKRAAIVQAPEGGMGAKEKIRPQPSDATVAARRLEPLVPAPRPAPADAADGPRSAGVHIGTLEVRIVMPDARPDAVVRVPAASAPARPSPMRAAVPAPARLSRGFGSFGLTQS